MLEVKNFQNSKFLFLNLNNFKNNRAFFVCLLYLYCVNHLYMFTCSNCYSDSVPKQMLCNRYG